jgi:2-iminobutanoate/2-iminopropanoate deaminase
MKKIINTKNAPQAIGPYNQGIITSQYIFLSGQIPFDKDGNLISDNIKSQTKQCLENLENILKSENLDKNNIVKTTIFLKDMNDFLSVNEEYSSFFNDTIYPARSTVEVNRLPKNVKIEIEAIAIKNN